MQVKILTGDNDIVSRKICHDVGLPVDHIVLGQEMDGLTPEALAKSWRRPRPRSPRCRRLRRRRSSTRCKARDMSWASWGTASTTARLSRLPMSGFPSTAF